MLGNENELEKLSSETNDVSMSSNITGYAICIKNIDSRNYSLSTSPILIAKLLISFLIIWGIDYVITRKMGEKINFISSVAHTCHWIINVYSQCCINLAMWNMNPKHFWLRIVLLSWFLAGIFLLRQMKEYFLKDFDV